MAFISEVVSMYDTKAECFKPVMQFRTKADAMRFVGDLASDKQNEIGRHPEDHILYHLGSFDDSNASFNLLERPVQLGLASDFMMK